MRCCAQLSAHVGSCTDVFSPPLLCQAVLVCLGLGLALHACALRALPPLQQAQAIIECSHDQFCSFPRPMSALPIRFQSQPDCPTAPMPLLYPRLRCALTELHCASSLRRGDPLPIHAPSLLSKVRAIARIWISRVNGNITSSFLDSIGNKGARPCLAPGTRPRPPPRPPLPPRLPNDSLALTLTLTLALTLTRRAPWACRRTRWRRRLRSSSGARGRGGRGGARRRCAAWPYPYP